MYTNKQQPQSEPTKRPKMTTTPNGAVITITIRDVITESGKRGLSINYHTAQEPDHETPASNVANLIIKTLCSSTQIIGEVIAETLSREDKP